MVCLRKARAHLQSFTRTNEISEDHYITLVPSIIDVIGKPRALEPVIYERYAILSEQFKQAKLQVYRPATTHTYQSTSPYTHDLVQPH